MKARKILSHLDKNRDMKMSSRLSERTNQTKIALAGSLDPAIEWAKQGTLSWFCSI